MLSSDVIKRIKQVEITTRRLLSGTFVGDYSSAKKGAGFEFDQIRDYQLGDDVRFIDWKASARSNKLLIKQYIEERNRSVIVVTDFSQSTDYSSSAKSKFDILTEIAAVLALVANYGKDQAALLIFTNEVEVFIPPAKGRKHIHKIMETLFSYKPKNSGTNIDIALEQLAKLRRKDSIVFLLSDFIDQIDEKKLHIVSKIYDLVAIECLDKNETVLPSVGFIQMEDLETDQQIVVDTRRRSIQSLNRFLRNRLYLKENICKKYGIDFLQVSPDRPFIGDIIKFFKRRMMY